MRTQQVEATTPDEGVYVDSGSVTHVSPVSAHLLSIARDLDSRPSSRRVLEALRADGLLQSTSPTADAPGSGQVWNARAASLAMSEALRRQALSGGGQRLGREPTTATVTGMDKWQGRIVDIDDDLFTAELVPQEGDAGGAVYADFELALLGDEEVHVGDVVYVTSRLVASSPGRQPTRTISVKLQRLGRWTEEEIEQIRERAAQRANELADYID